MISSKSFSLLSLFSFSIDLKTWKKHEYRKSHLYNEYIQLYACSSIIFSVLASKKNLKINNLLHGYLFCLLWCFLLFTVVILVNNSQTQKYPQKSFILSTVASMLQESVQFLIFYKILAATHIIRIMLVSKNTYIPKSFQRKKW